MNKAEIVIVGGGAAGLAAAGALKKRGLTAVVLERDTSIGGTWARRYDRLHLHTIRQLSGLPHLPIPRRLPRYLSRDQYVRYLQAYARRMRLRVITGCEVSRVSPDGDYWLIETRGETWRTPVVVLATGQYSVPHIPDWSNLSEFQGKVIHSSEYRNGHAWAGKRALVVGVGNSGAEIATDLAESGASFVAISIRTPPFMTRRDSFGLPVQLIGFPLGWLPPRLADSVARGVMRAAFSDMSRYGLAQPGYSPYIDGRVPLIDVGFAAAVKQERVAIRKDLSSFTTTGVRFADGQVEEYDLVVAATGFSSGLAQLLDLPGALDAHGEPGYPSGAPTPWPGLYFIGFTHSLHGHLFEAHRAALRLAAQVVSYLR